MTGVRTLDIYHFNDFHRHLAPLPGGLGGAARLSTIARETRAAHPDSVLVSVGDVAGDQSALSSQSFEPVPAVFNRMGVDLLALGNHEFEDPAGHYSTLVNALIKPLHAQTLCANVTETRSGQQLPHTQSYSIRQLAGLNVAFIGVVTQDLSSKLFPAAGAGLRAAPVDRVLAELVPKVRAEGADVVVVMAHEGLREARHIARDVEGIDVILAADDHIATERPICVDRGDGNHTWIAEGGAYGASLGHISITVDAAARRVLTVDGNQIPVTSDTPPDTCVQAIVDAWKPLPREERPSQPHHWATVQAEDLARVLGLPRTIK